MAIGFIFIGVGISQPCVVWAATVGTPEQGGREPNAELLNQAPILVYGVHGQVTVTTAENATPVALKNDQKLKQGCVVSTGPKSSVDLIFSNGAVLALDSNTVLSVDEFLQAGDYDISIPIPQSARGVSQRPNSIGAIDREPSYSRTRIFLREGAMYAQVKHLHKKSTYLVGNPLGVSKILGTTWRQRVGLNRKNRRKSNKIQLKEGLIQYDPIAGQDRSPQSVFIHPQEEIKVEATFSSVEAMDQIVTAGAFNGDVNLDVEHQPIQDPDFPVLVTAFLPANREQEITSNGPKAQGASQSSDFGAASFAGGDQGVGDFGTQVGGSGGGGTVNNVNNTGSHPQKSKQSNGGSEPPSATGDQGVGTIGTQIGGGGGTGGSGTGNGGNNPPAS